MEKSKYFTGSFKTNFSQEMLDLMWWQFCRDYDMDEGITKEVF